MNMDMDIKPQTKTMPIVQTALKSQKILVVDDDEFICKMMKDALADHYDVTVCLCGADAQKQIDNTEFDLIVTDLVMPDISGVEILEYAKSRDEFVEVLMVTGYPTVDSATAAVNGGAGSYMTKPFSINELRARVDKMIMTRAFHKKSLQLLNSSGLVDPAVKGHVDDITTLYHFTRKLMLTLEISEVMKITLEEANVKLGAKMCSIEINIYDHAEVYVMPLTGQVSQEHVKKIFSNNFQDAFLLLAKESFENDQVMLQVYKGKQGEFCELPEYKCINFPLTVTGKSIGSLSVWVLPQYTLEYRLEQYLNIITSIVSPVIEHVYADLQARFQAKTDGLTGIANHRHFYEALEREIARTNRKKNTFALLLADIDNFKLVNDTYGHQIGDAVIIELTKRLKENVRTGDVVARYGGEEFCVILPETDLEGAKILAERIRESVANTPYSDATTTLSFSASFGLAMYDGCYPCAKDKLIQIADEALYESKKTGKNKVTVGSKVNS